jgi:hypothetical protein
MIFAGGDVTKRAGAMSDNETQIGVCVKSARDLKCYIFDHIQLWSVGLGLVGDQGSAEFEKDEFLHGSYLTTKT